MKRFGIAPLNERMAKAADLSSCIHPDYIDNPQPGPPVPLIDASISEILADVGRSTSQEELFLAAGVALDEPFRRKVQAVTRPGSVSPRVERDRCRSPRRST